jgi:hypothetical protein
MNFWMISPVKKEQAIAVIEIASKILTSKNIEQIYEAAA